MTLIIITKEDKKIEQPDVEQVEFYGGSMHIVLTTGETANIPAESIAYFRVVHYSDVK